MSKHFNMGNVFGRVVIESIERKPSKNSEFLNFQINVAGRHCGSVKAFCRMWQTERIDAFMAHVRARPHDPLCLKGFFGQYWDERNTVYSTFTIHKWEVRESDPRAAFILKGQVDVISAVKGGHRLLLNYSREGQETERLEFWLQDETLLDTPQAGDLLEIKGYLRQEQPEDDFGGSTGPVRAYLEKLRVIS
ncbi:hypothetical protein [Geopsychrobacter electrodiphilus]|uniref:hypothetical protein n=1 Tax=Geopsychrobacter electrodiphilus TaxID=225196 RepID=UPI000373A84C|nr:hypothetical protein [Geopsychrobacter electrodiphilus]